MFRREGRNENRDQERKQEGFFTIGDVTNSMIENGTNSMIVDKTGPLCRKTVEKDQGIQPPGPGS